MYKYRMLKNTTDAAEVPPEIYHQTQFHISSNMTLYDIFAHFWVCNTKYRQKYTEISVNIQISYKPNLNMGAAILLPRQNIRCEKIALRATFLFK